MSIMFRFFWGLANLHAPMGIAHGDTEKGQGDLPIYAC